MKQYSVFRKCTIAIIICMPFFAIGQIETRKITFASGKSSSIVTSSVKGDQTIDYKIAAKDGQELKVTMTTNNNANFFNVLPPGSADEAIYVGSTDGTNKFGGSLGTSGEYTVRIYLMRSAARKNEKGSFTLSVSLTGGSTGNNDALVPGTKYNATGKVRSSLGDEKWGSVLSEYGVIRHSSTSAQVDVTYPGGLKRVLIFNKGEWTAPDSSVKVARKPGEWEVNVNDYEHYLIPDEVITGG